MLSAIQIGNFKCFENLELCCAPLTLLCGLNGMGKSSIFQSLLVLRQSFESGELSHGRLVLNGEFAELGTGKDVLYEEADTDTLAFELSLDHRTPSDIPVGGPLRLSFDYSRAEDELRHTLDNQVTTSELVIPSPWTGVPPLGGELVYVNAERIGPRKLHMLSAVRARYGKLGSRGEYALNLLHAQQDKILTKSDPRCQGSQSRRLLDIIDFWLQAVSPGVHLKIEPIPDADAILAGFSFDRPGDVATQSYRATNVGFGLSYVLPVLVGLLASQPGTLCLIENPEAHLHPRGQTKLAELTVLASRSGVQVIVETHSDHFIDGVRIAARDGMIQPDEVAIHYFERSDGKAGITTPELDSDGRLSCWPDGFFDQHEENLTRLLAPPNRVSESPT